MAYWRTPLDLDQIEIPHGNLYIDIEQCKGCAFCIEYCPRDVLELSPDFNNKGYHYPITVKKDSCVNCNLCEMICPDFAIFCLEGQTRNPEPKEVVKG